MRIRTSDGGDALRTVADELDELEAEIERVRGDNDDLKAEIRVLEAAAAEAEKARKA